MTHQIRFRNSVIRGVFAGLGSLLAIGAQAEVRAPSSPVVAQWGAPSVAAGLAVGDQSSLRIELTPAPGWHLYWKNPGDSGLPVQVEWDFSRARGGIEKQGALRFPRPTVQTQGKLINFGYAGTLTLEQPVRVAERLAGQMIEVRARLKWLVCKESCIPGKAELVQSFTVAAKGASIPPPTPAGEFVFPEKLPADMRVRVEQTQADWVLTLEPFSRLGWKTPVGRYFFFPEEPGVVEHSGLQRFERIGDLLRVTLPRAVSVAPVALDSFAGVLASGEKGSDRAVEIRLQGLAPAASGAGVEKVSVFWAFFGAFLGGLILNLMPCVFPVLWLKILALLQARAAERKHAVQGAVVYALGILVSFWLLAGALMALRAGGGKLGWGFQLQSPAFVSLLVLLMGIIALNLFGVFEFSLGRFEGVGSNLAHRRSVVGSFFTGVLATVVATPCTAPFMGASIGYALTQSPWVGFGVFTALGIGLAFPFVVFAAFPALGRWVPKPGAWMETLRRVLGVPILLTGVWLLWVLSLQAGRAAVVLVLIAFAAVTLAAFAVGSRRPWGVRGGVAGFVGVPLLTALFLASGSLGPFQFRAASLPGSGDGETTGLRWETWSPGAVTRARDSGQAVLIDFTAAWCVTCQVNEQVAFGDATVQATLAQRHVALFKADWTQSDPRITEALGSFGRNGVPLYVYYPTGKRPERIWPQILTPAIVLGELTDAEAGSSQAASSSSTSKP